jgi:hypothetical protein
MKLSERDPLKGLRDTALSLEDASVAEARGRYVSERLAQTIREVPARRRAAQRQRAAVWGGAAVAMLGLALIVAGQMRRNPVVASTPATAAQGVAMGPSAAQGEAIGPSAQRDTVKGIIEELAGQVDIVNAEGRTTSAVRASTLEPSDEIVTRTYGRGSIVLPCGARVDLSRSSRLRLQASSSPASLRESRLALLEGKVDVHVPHLDRGSSFAVVTPQAEVTVHGTVFSVEVLGPGDELAETCVVVSEGLVAVRSVGSEALLGPGMHWSSRANGSRCVTPRMPRGVPLASGSRRKIGVLGARASASSAAHASRAVETDVGQSDLGSLAPSAPINSLAAQNRLFEAAMVARQEGDDRKAIQLFDELLRKYPDSTLAPEAHEQRRRAQEHLQKGQPGLDP